MSVKWKKNTGKDSTNQKWTLFFGISLALRDASELSNEVVDGDFTTDG